MSHRSRLVRASVGGVLAGGTLGFTLGLLLAPNEGRQLRRRVQYLLDRWAGQVGQALDRLDPAADASLARQHADALVADAREQAARLLDEADALMSAARQRRSAVQPDIRPDERSGARGES